MDKSDPDAEHCSTCGAQPGESCQGRLRRGGRHHAPRIDTAVRKWVKERKRVGS